MSIHAVTDDHPTYDGRKSATGLRAITENLARRRAEAVDGPAPRQQAGRKLTARERIELLLDEGTFVETGQLVRHRATAFGIGINRPDTDGVVTGWGLVDGRRIFVYAQDPRVFGGSVGEAHARKVHTLMDLAESTRCPIVAINDGGGARIQEGVASLAGVGGIFARSVHMSGVVPQLAVVLGSCAGGAAYAPALNDVIFMVRQTSNMFVTGPDVVAQVTGEQVSPCELGGAEIHGASSGLATFVYDDEEECLLEVRYLLSFLPSHNEERPPRFEPLQRRYNGENLLDVVPSDPRVGYDVRQVLDHIVDDGEYLEFHADWATNVVCALSRLGGEVVGFVANQPAVRAGVLDAAAAEKAARFVRTCDAFNIPLVSLVDVPGFLPGVDQEHSGLIRRGAKLLYAYCEATVPRVQVILRKAYGGAYIVMNSKSIGADLCLAWPGNEIAVMGAQAAARVIFRREIEAASDPKARSAELIEQYERTITPFLPAELGVVDDIIDPRETRQRLVEALAMLRTKCTDLARRKHGNIPL
ncbi:acyl-CoA carboxylase subunit beta [Kribbella sp. NBC_00359]|uniref:acyl-CoA carboxylase subunit beta n=1 Tax=Kribbella sp. NBC_00359 TaxID=2975966 RepID=UPI002E207C30